MSVTTNADDRGHGRTARWYLLVTVGSVAFAAALLVLLVPETAALIPTDALVELLGNDYFLLGTLGLVAVAALARIVARRATTSVDQADPPEPETVAEAPRPGQEFDDLLAGRLAVGSHLVSDRDDRVRERLREAATLAVMRTERCPREDARRRVEAGDWTDEPVAATFLRPDGPSPSLGKRARLALRGESWLQHCARTTANEIASVGGERR